MASILALPNDLIELIGAIANEQGGVKDWCRLVSTCRRLWRLQIPKSHLGLHIPSIIGIEGMAWALHRLKASPSLRVDCHLDWNFEKPRASVAKLQKHAEAAAAASGDFQCLRLLTLGTTSNCRVMPKSARRHLQQWEQALILGSINLEALMIWANAVPCPPALRCLPNLKFLELTLEQSEAWLGYFFVDLSFCACLESLKLTQTFLGVILGSCKLPDVQLSALSKLKHFKLMGWFPGAAFSLPPDCELCIVAARGERPPWDPEQWRLMQRNLTVLNLWDMSLQEWPTGIAHLSRLQCFRQVCNDFIEQDLAMLRAIPNVSVFCLGMASLTLTAGVWKSLEVSGQHGVCITFTDADSFVTGTERFLFCSSGRVEVSQPMCASVGAACSRQLKTCYQSTFRSMDGKQTVRLSNCEDAMRLEPSSDGKIVPSGGLHDGYAGTPKDSPLWERINGKPLVTGDDVWPKWEPHKWVFGS